MSKIVDTGPAAPAAHPPVAALARFVHRLETAVAATSPQARLLDEVSAAMRELIARDDWLDPRFATPHPQFYQQYLLHLDPADRFSVVSFVWGPGQRTPVHDHCTWGVIGVLRGAENGQAYRVERGSAGSRLVAQGGIERLNPGDVALVSPEIGDIHVVSNAFDDRVSISIHVYGVDIGKQERHVFDAVTGEPKAFVSGYVNRPRAAA